MKRIYGGIIGGVQDADYKFLPKTPPFMRENSIFVSTERAAFDMILGKLKPRKIWLPDYLCKTMLTKTLLQSNWGTYPINRNLVPELDFLDHVKTNDLVICNNYFGFPYYENMASMIQNQGAWVLEDSSMGLFTNSNPLSNFVLRSLSKNLGLSHGAVLQSQCHIHLTGLRTDPPIDWVQHAENARIGRRKYDDNKINDKNWIKEAEKAKRACPAEQYAISDHVRSSVMNRYNYNDLKNIQRRNYTILWEELDSCRMLPLDLGMNSDYPGGFFPIMIDNRDKVKQKLFADNIFPAIHWRLPWKKQKASAAMWLSEKLLSIPCDWRYNEEDIYHIASRVSLHVENSHT